MKNKKALALSLFTIAGILCITFGLTLALFEYSQQGTTDNTITAGSVTFLYTENANGGRGINIEDAFPITDEAGKALIGDDNVFNFNISSNNLTNINIPFEITARKSDTSTLSEDVVKVYLTKVSGISEEELLIDTYNNLIQTGKTTNYTEKVLYTDVVPANDTYSQDYRLRMWVDENTDYTDGNYNNKTFTIKVNVYANANVVSVNNN